MTTRLLFTQAAGFSMGKNGKPQLQWLFLRWRSSHGVNKRGLAGRQGNDFSAKEVCRGRLARAVNRVIFSNGNGLTISGKRNNCLLIIFCTILATTIGFAHPTLFFIVSGYGF